jgi:type I restriction enzyme S subunit
LKTGPFGSSLKPEFFVENGNGVPVLNISALGEMELDNTGLTYIAPEYAELFSAYTIQDRDIVFSRVADVGRCVLMNDNAEGWIISSNLIRIRLDPNKG